MDDPGSTPRQRRLGSIFHLPFRSKNPGSRSQSIDSSFRKTEVNSRQSGPKAPSKLRRNVDDKGSFHTVEWLDPALVMDDSARSFNKAGFPVVRGTEGFERDKQTGEVIDHTEMLHSLGLVSTNEDPNRNAHWMRQDEPAVSGDQVVSRLKPDTWLQILDHLNPADTASLAYSCKAFQELLGVKPWTFIRHPDNRDHKLKFLARLDKYLPDHLLCFDCGIYHIRTQRGQESLKPSNTLNPVYECPNASNPNKIFPRIRLTLGRILPFTFVQLALRASNHSPDHGIAVDSLSRRYKDRDSQWFHQTRYVIIKGHLLMRVTSQCFATPGLPPAGERHLLYSRADFVPYFSVCPHWRDGELMPMVKCALHHLPIPPSGSGIDRVAQDVKLRFHPPNPIVTLCNNCRPMRRCPECPTEYLIEMKMAEDKSDPSRLFKHALVLTRWSDLGDGLSPWSPEWAACNGAPGFDSFAAIGKRAISGVFESEVYGDVLPGQKILSLNPNKENKGEAGHNWY